MKDLAAEYAMLCSKKEELAGEVIKLWKTLKEFENHERSLTIPVHNKWHSMQAGWTE